MRPGARAAANSVVDVKTIRGWVDTHAEELVETLRRYVGLPSENRVPFGDEWAAQQAFSAELEALGFAVEQFEPDQPQGVTEHPAYLPGRHYRKRPCVAGVLRGTGGGRSLLFSGHMDTVPRGLEPWVHPPFAGRIEDGRLYGLGVLDMKAGLVAGLLAMRALRELGWQGRGDVWLESVVDEEFGGANGTLACRVRGIEADLAIVAEPTQGAVCFAHRGGHMLRFTFQGRAGHFVGSSLNQAPPPNPIRAASRYVELLEAFNEWRNRRPVPPGYEANPALPLEWVQMIAGDPALPMGDRNPGECTLTAWLECDPETTEQQLLDDLNAFTEPRMAEDPVLSLMPPKITPALRFLEGSTVDPTHPGVMSLVASVTDVTGAPPPVAGAPFACDAFLFNRYSRTPAILFGPRGANAHAADEHVLLDDFLDLVAIFAVMTDRWSG